MTTVKAHYQAWVENWPLGTLAGDGQRVLFDYALQALAKAWSLAEWLDTKKPTVWPRWVWGFLNLNWLAPAGD
jgi:hypothetical protein